LKICKAIVILKGEQGSANYPAQTLVYWIAPECQC